MPLTQPGAGMEGHERGRPGGRRRKAEERHVEPGDRGSDHPALPPHPEPTEQDQHPAGDHAHVQARDGQQMGQAGPGEAVSQIAWQIVPPAEHERLDEARAWTVQCIDPRGDSSSDSVPASTSAREHAGMRDADDTARVRRAHRQQNCACRHGIADTKAHLAVALLGRVEDGTRRGATPARCVVDSHHHRRGTR